MEIPTMGEFQAEGSWAPATPLKPAMPQPGPICEDGHNIGLMGQPVMNNGSNTCLKSTCSLSSAEMSMSSLPQNTRHGKTTNNERVNVQPNSYPNFGGWDMPLPWEISNGANSSYPNIGFENMSFGELLAMTGPALAPSLISDRLEDRGGAVMSSGFHGLNPQPGTNSLDSSSVIRSQQGLQQLNQQFVPHSSAYPWSQRSVNSSPRTMHISGEQFAFAPHTPDSRSKTDTMVAQELNGLKEHEAANAAVDSQSLNSKQVVQPATCSSPGKVSVSGEENHNPDLGDNHCIDLNKTPPLKKKRRKRYQPKVVKENKPKRTPRPKTPGPTGEKEGPRKRRKYVRKKKEDATSDSVIGETKTTENKPKKRTSKTCKKSLNFNLDGEGKSKDKETEKVMGNSMGNNAGEIPSPCVSSNEGVQRTGSKRVLSSITGEADVYAGNVATNNGTYCPPNHILVHNVDNNGVHNFADPYIHKKQRIDKGQGLHASKYYYHHNASALYGSNAGTSNQVEMLMRRDGNKAQLLNTWVDITRLNMTAQTATLDAHNVEPVEGVPLFSHGESSGKGKAPRRKKSDILKTHQPGSSSHSNQPNSVDPNTGAPIEDTDKKPKAKRSKKQNPVSDSTSRGKKSGLVYTPGSVPIPPMSMTILLEAITVGIKQLDLNKEQRVELVPHPQNALVLYRNDGTLAPFEPQFDPVRRRGQRAKVELDDETTRVWMLLLENIDSEGIDGTTEEKRKWWENERSVFHGRVDSFIARMRLVQGDRRFTPWKGSVLDSVVGVFLTQNVSDHLSSSAFMSLAARFPIKPNNDGNASLEEIIEPDVCITQPDETVTCNENPVDQPTYARLNNETDHHTEIKEDDVNQEIRVGAASGSVGPLDCSSQSSLKADAELSFNKDNTHITETEAGNNLGDYRACDDGNSSLLSMMSSQNSVNSASSSESDRFGSSTSFLGLLKMAESPMLHDSYNQILGYDPAKAPNICSGDPQVCKESDFQLKNATSIQMMEIESKSSATLKKDEIWKDSQENVGSSTLGKQTSPIWNCPNLGNSSQETADVTTGSTVTLERTANEQKEVSGHSYTPGGSSNVADANPIKSKRQMPEKDKKNAYDWDNLRKQAQANGRNKERPPNTQDSVDWEAVRHTDVSVLAETIKERGMSNVLAGRIKDLLDKLVKDHGSTDLEWLRDIPPDKAKEYLLSFRGLGLKSVECVRLLTLHHLAFPVDTNVGRIAVRLGWVPLQPLPESIQLHLLEMYPIMESIQQYLWPRLCKLDQKTLYELHYHLITFGKVFCTKRQPNCNACPLRGECRHFASAFASARLALPGPEERRIVASNNDNSIPIDPHNNIKPLPLPPPPMTNNHPPTNFSCNSNATIVEVPSTPLSLNHLTQPTFTPQVHCDPIVEVPASPEPEREQTLCDIEDSVYEDPNEIPTIELNMEKFTQTLQNVMQANRELQESGMSRALVALTPEAASIPMPKLKNISRLRTEHHVYELPDTHPLLADWDKREHDDPCSYLLAIWTPGETANTIQPPNRRCSSDDPSILCHEETCAYCSSQREANSQTVRGTLLIPCRTAMRGSFPLNGTYFQVNEVFADHESSLNPINVPRSWLWNLPRRTVYFGTSVPTIFRGLTTEEIQYCFWRGFVCVRGFDKKSRAPRPLMARLHFPASKMPKGAKGKVDEE